MGLRGRGSLGLSADPLEKKGQDSQELSNKDYSNVTVCFTGSLKRTR